MQLTLPLLFANVLLLGTARLAAAAPDASTPEPRLSSGGGARQALYERADPLNLFGLRRGVAGAESGAVGSVLEAGLARGMKVGERQLTCQQSGYGLCPDQSGCCPLGGQCCPGRICCSASQGTCSRVFDAYECCPPGISCNGIDGCRTGRRACPRDTDSCCPVGASCIYGSDGKATGCSGGGGGGVSVGDNGSGVSPTSVSFSFTSASSITGFASNSLTLSDLFPTSSTTSRSSITLPSPSLSSSTSASAGPSSFNPFGAAVPRAERVAAPLVAVAVAFVAGALAL